MSSLPFCHLLTLYGTQEARELAKGMLENHPHVRRLDAFENNAKIKLLMTSPIAEPDLIGMLSRTGLHAVQLEKNTL